MILCFALVNALGKNGACCSLKWEHIRTSGSQGSVTYKVQRSALSLKATTENGAPSKDDAECSDCSNQERRRFAIGAASLFAAGVASPAVAIDFPKNLFDMGGKVEESESGFPLRGDESIMKKKKHGTSDKSVMKSLRYGCDPKLADQICNYNRHFAEYAGYFTTTNWLDEVDKTKETTYYDSVTGKPLFIAPRGRSFEQFVKESKVHGWPSFRDEVPHVLLLHSDRTCR